MIDLDRYPLTDETTEDEILEWIEEIREQMQQEHGVDIGTAVTKLLDGTATRRDIVHAALTIVVSAKSILEQEEQEWRGYLGLRGRPNGPDSC